MNHWLVKTEPSEWSWDHHVKAGSSAWTGVRNPQAQNNLKAMKKGDRALFYHTGDQKRIVGVVAVAREAFADPTDKSGKLVAVKFKALAPVPKPVTLADVKAEPKLKDMVLVKNSRLSVQPVTAEQWKLIAQMTGLKR